MSGFNDSAHPVKHQKTQSQYDGGHRGTFGRLKALACTYWFVAVKYAYVTSLLIASTCLKVMKLCPVPSCTRLQPVVIIGEILSGDLPNS